MTTAGLIVRVGASLLSLPLGLVLSPITAPVLTVIVEDKSSKPSGDLTEE